MKRPAKKKSRLSVYEKIMNAAEAMRGLHLTEHEVFTLSQDTAISHAAENMQHERENDDQD